MDIGVWQLTLGMVFGAIGMGWFAYGKKQQHMVALGVGLLLMVFPYFVPNPWAMGAAGLVLSAVPFLVSV
ncbi:MAG: amino acid transport protein [Planctomycetes bacterium]|nr:amino acid transport protein [Planctomycetota bacterium]